VPDFSKPDFSMSGLVLSSAFAGMTPSAKADDLTKDILKPPPSTARDFAVTDTIWAFVEVYDNQAKTPHQVDIRTLLRAEDGRTVFKTEEQRSSDELQGARGGFGHVSQIPLRDIAPGEYVVRVEAQSRLSASPLVARETIVRVWGIPSARQAPSDAAVPAPARSVVSVARGAMSNITSAKTAVARTDGEWQALWSSLPLRTAAPKVNFESTMIVAVFTGVRPSAGYNVEVVNVRQDGDALVVEYAEQTPPEGSMNADVITTPFAIAGVPMHAGDVRFERVPPPRP
jgi:hypothetical protein